MTRSQRRFGLILAALAASAGIYGLWWNGAAESAKAELERWIEARRSAGFEITHDGISKTGFPLRIELAVANAKVAKGGRNPFSWQGPPRLAAEIKSLTPVRLILRAQGQHVLEQDGRRVTATFGVANFGMTEGVFGPEALHADIRNAVAEGIWPSPVRLGRLNLDVSRRFDVALEDLQTPSATLSLGLEQLALPPEAKPLLGPELARLSARISLRGPVPEALRAEPLRAWSAAGGVLDLESMHAEWGALTLDGDGTLALDRQLLPIAPFGLKAKGVFETVDALEAQGIVAPENAMVVKLALAVLAKEPPDPDTGLMRLPLTLQGRDLFIGPARLVRLRQPPWAEE